MCVSDAETKERGDRPEMTTSDDFFISKERTLQLSPFGPQRQETPQVSGDRVRLRRSIPFYSHSLLAAPDGPHPRTQGRSSLGQIPLEESPGVAPDRQTPRAADTPPSQLKHGARERTADHPEGWCGSSWPRLSLWPHPDRPLQSTVSSVTMGGWAGDL